MRRTTTFGAERSRLCGAAGGARESLSQEGERGLDFVARELLVRPVRDHAAPAALAVGVVFVHLDANPWVFAQHRRFAAFGRDRDDRAVLVGVDERDDVRHAVCVAAEARDPLPAQELVDLAAAKARAELLCRASEPFIPRSA